MRKWQSLVHFYSIQKSNKREKNDPVTSRVSSPGRSPSSLDSSAVDLARHCAMMIRSPLKITELMPLVLVDEKIAI